MVAVAALLRGRNDHPCPTMVPCQQDQVRARDDVELEMHYDVVFLPARIQESRRAVARREPQLRASEHPCGAAMFSATQTSANFELKNNKDQDNQSC